VKSKSVWKILSKDELGVWQMLDTQVQQTDLPNYTVMALFAWICRVCNSTMDPLFQVLSKWVRRYLLCARVERGFVHLIRGAHAS
jgi:hypothetical protein